MRTARHELCSRNKSRLDGKLWNTVTPSVIMAASAWLLLLWLCVSGVHGRLHGRHSALPASFLRTCRLRGGGGFGAGFDDQVTPDEIRDIGGDVLKMWEVSHVETEEERIEAEKTEAASKARSRQAGKLTEEQARKLISGELDAKRPGAVSTGRGEEGPEQKSNEGERSAQGELGDLMMCHVTGSHTRSSEDRLCNL